jgi:hypothetical protein
MSREKLEEILDEIAYGNTYGEVLRAKGMVPAADDGKDVADGPPSGKADAKGAGQSGDKGAGDSAPAAATWLYFDLVPEEVAIREGEPHYTGKVCVIGANLNESALEEAFGG